MNENPEGTPNPLNPNPGPAPADAGPAPAAPAPQPAPQPVAQPVAQPVVAEPTAVPAAESEPKDSVVEPKNKSKKGLIIAVVLLLFAIIGGVVAAILILKPFGGNGDAVSMAMQKLFEGTGPARVAVDGSIIATSDSSDGKVKIDFKSGVDTVSKENYANIELTLISPDDDEFSIGADEVYTSDGDLYFRVSNIEDLVDYLVTANTTDTFCLEDDFDCAYIDGGCTRDQLGNVSCSNDYPQSSSSMPSYLSDIIEIVDGEWIRVSSSDFSSLVDMAESNIDSTAQCLIDTAEDADKYKDDFVGFYKENPFVNSTTENIKIEQKKSQPYLISLDGEKLTGFLNSVAGSDFTKELAACGGSSVDSGDINEEDV